MYISSKVSKGLMAQLYLMNDPFNNYPTLELAYSEPDAAVQSLTSQGVNLKEFIFFNGIRGPIKIWRVNYPENILAREEFLRTSGGYAEFDDLVFTK